MTGNVIENNSQATDTASERALLIAGVVAFITGVLVFDGWFLNIPILVRLHPAVPGMAFDAAVLLAVTGAGLLAYSRRHSRLTLLCGGITVVAGILTLAQYLFGVDLRIDQFFSADRLAERMPYPGRMAPNAALAFILSGLALLLLGTPVRHSQRCMFLGIIGGALAMLALVSPFLHFMIGQTTAFARVIGPDMAPTLSFGLVVVGAGFVVYAWRHDRDPEIAIPRWLPVLVGITTLACVLTVWQALREQESLNADNIVKSEASGVAREIRLRLDGHVNGLLRMARRWEKRGKMPKAEWEADALLYEQHLPGYRSIEWVDPRFHVRWVVPAENAAQWYPAGKERQALFAAGQRREVMLMHGPKSRENPAESLIVYVPFTGSSGFAGYISGVFDVKELFDAILHPALAPGYVAAVSRNGREIYRRGDDRQISPAMRGREAGLDMYGAGLSVRVWPADASSAALLRSRVPETVLGLGILLSLMLALTAYFAQNSWRRARLLRTANVSLYGEILGHLQALEKVEKSERRYRQLMEHAADGILVTDVSGNLLDANGSGCEMLGYTREELLRLNARDLFPAEELAARPMRFPEVLSGQTVIIERPLLRKDGATLPVEINVKLIGDNLQAIVRDISARREAEMQMRKLSGAIQQTADPVVITDVAGVIEYANPAFERLTGYNPDEIRGTTPRFLKSGRHDNEFYKRLWGTILGGETFHDVFINRRKNGSLYYEEKTITPLKDERGRITHFISTAKNVTEQQNVQERLLHLTQHDILTQLPNRALFMDRLSRTVTRTKWDKRLLAVLLLDIDDLGILNDTLGHEIGDRLLQLLAGRLGECMRDQDTVARLGGDEFGIILESADTSNDFSLAIQKLHALLSMPYRVDGQDMSATVSIGISLFPDDGGDAPALVRNATTAASRAREQGRNNFRFYRTDLNTRMMKRFGFEADLRRALEHKEFVLHYQPQVDIKTKRICGVEALLRWQHPQRGLLAPLDFLPLLEETGLIVPLGGWLLRTACEQNSAWQATGLLAVPVAANISYQQLGESDFPGLVDSILNETGLAPRFLQFEISDRILSREARVTQEVLRALNARGIEIIADDFIVGDSSVKYLNRLSVNAMKIDASFLLCEPDNAGEAVMTDAVISSAHKQNLKGMADGVETEQHLGLLQASGCDVAQGHVFGKPMPAMEVTRLLQKGELKKS